MAEMNRSENNTPQIKPTMVNPGANMINPAGYVDGALRNESLSDRETVVNPGGNHGQFAPFKGENATFQSINLEIGTILEGGYVVKEHMNTESGESELYKCEKDNEEYVAKVYYRLYDRDERISSILMAITHPNIARLIFEGTIYNHTFHVFKYYPAGSIADRLAKGVKYTFKELREIYIPELNNAINALHKNGIIHRDIKPSNLMVSSENRPVLIDFGIASMLEKEYFTKVTGARFTSGYQAPEIALGICKAFSDYYSLGVTLYEMYCGEMPNWLNGLDIDQPDGMEDELFHLIRGLTYFNYQTRSDNSAHRWGYQEVCDWLNGKEPVVPGLQTESAPHTPGGSVFSTKLYFRRTAFSDMDALCMEMATCWNDGLRFVFSGDMNEQLLHETNAHRNAWIAALHDCIDIGDTPRQKFSERQKNNRYTELLYQLSPELGNRIVSELGSPMSPNEFGDRILETFRKDEPVKREIILEVVLRLCVSKRLTMISSAANHPDVNNIGRIVEKINHVTSKHGRLCMVCALGYTLASEDRLILPNKASSMIQSEIHDMKSFGDELYRMSQGNARSAFDFFCQTLPEEKKMEPLLFGWLEKNGGLKTIGEWLC